MPSITMCRGDGCPLRESCLRYTAKPSRRQSYFVVAPVELDDTCERFLPVNPEQES